MWILDGSTSSDKYNLRILISVSDQGSSSSSSIVKNLSVETFGATADRACRSTVDRTCGRTVDGACEFSDDGACG